jgi:hypothetical protein
MSNRSHTTRRLSAVFGGVALAGLVAGLGAQAASAGTATSANGYSTIHGHQYVTRAYVTTSTKQAYAGTVNVWSSGSTTAGWAGSRGRLFTSAGKLSCEGSTMYNRANGSQITGLSCTRTTTGAWYSYGVAQGWTGSGYQSFYTFKSPNQNS